jgi:hypothetical protein
MLRKVICGLILEAINPQLYLQLKSTQRITILPRKLDISLGQSFKQPNMNNPSLKPSGIWYSFGKAWSDFAKDAPGLSDKYNESEYVYEILGVQTTDLENPNPNKVLVLRTKDEAAAFVKKYNVKRAMRYVFAPWDVIAKDFGGLEIPDHAALDSYFGGWDVVSGCVWNLNAIRAKQLQGPAVISKSLEGTHENFAEDVGEWISESFDSWIEEALLEGDYDIGEGIEDAENIYDAIAILLGGVDVYDLKDEIVQGSVRIRNTDAGRMNPRDRLLFYLHLKSRWSPVSWGTEIGTNNRLNSRFERDHPGESPEDILDQIFESVLRWYGDSKRYKLNGNQAFEQEKYNY